MKTAILIDGGFYRKRAQIMLGNKSPSERANELNNYCYRHLIKNTGPDGSLGAAGSSDDLYRIFYYDCPPMAKKVYHPFLKKTIDFSKSDLYTWMTEFLFELKKKRKFALRLGKLSEDQAHFTLRPEIVKKLFSGSLAFSAITENDFYICVDQKGVDMKIGLDISSLAQKNQVDRIVLISGDSDFVPAAKHARREGIDFILDPLFSKVKDELYEHIDGLMTRDNRFKPSP